MSQARNFEGSMANWHRVDMPNHRFLYEFRKRFLEFVKEQFTLAGLDMSGVGLEDLQTGWTPPEDVGEDIWIEYSPDPSITEYYDDKGEYLGAKISWYVSNDPWEARHTYVYDAIADYFTAVQYSESEAEPEFWLLDKEGNWI